MSPALRRRAIALGLLTGFMALGLLLPQEPCPREAPEVRARALLGRLRDHVDAWHRRFGAYPPTRLERLRLVARLPTDVGRVVPPNDSNRGIEALLQALRVAGLTTADLTDAGVSNTDDDGLDKALPDRRLVRLPEIADPWGHPFVYFEAEDYVDAERSPPDYVNGHGDGIQPRPWRTAGGEFAQPGSFQIYSVGPDGLPNTDDDLRSWDPR